MKENQIQIKKWESEQSKNNPMHFLEVKEILDKLRQKDSDLFTQVISAIRHNDEHEIRALAVEVAEIRKVIMTIEHVMMDVQPSGQKYPDLVLCPSCCSPEISISNTRCICLECGRDWIVGVKHLNAIENIQYCIMA